MSFLLSIMSLFTVLSVRVEWINHVLDIPLFSNVEDYKEIPEAQLYINDILVNDPLIYYERDGVDHTFFSVITSSHVRIFTMRYRVHFPTYDVIHTQDIVFNIVDLDPPEIINVPSFRVPLDEDMPDLLQGLVIQDNYDELEDLIISVNSLEVILSQTGIYSMYYQVCDTSGNISLALTILEVYDYQAPTIILENEIIICFGTTFNWRDFMTIRDNDDSFPYVLVDDTAVNYSLLGLYEITVYATDKNGLTSQKTMSISIIDDEKPMILLKSQPSSISVFSNEFDMDFLYYILQVSDNYDALKIEDVTYTHDIEFDVLGTYNVYYELKDYSGNIGEINLKVCVIDSEEPTIIIIYQLIFDVFDAKPFFIDYIDYIDNYTPRGMLTFKMTESVDMDKVGMYPLVIEVTDKSYNKAILRTYIEIIDQIEPQIIQLNDILITDFSSKELIYYFEASDNYDQATHIDIQIDDSTVNYESIGCYMIIIYAFDLSDNVGILSSEVMVVDIIDPILLLKQDFVIIEVFSSPLNLDFYIQEASDNYDELTIESVTIQDDINYSQIGKYSVTYQIIDSSMNVMIKTLDVTVDDMSPPIVTTSSMILRTGDFCDPLFGFEVIDNLEETKITWSPQIIDTNTPGRKTISYVVTDSRGNYTTFEREIIVEPMIETFDLIQYLPVILITVIGIGVGFYFYKQMH